MTTTLRIMLLVLLCALVLPASAQVYRWIDKDGKVHYTDQKPPDVQAEALAIKSANSLGGNADAAATPTTAPAAAAAPANPNDPNAALKKEVDALNAQRCSAAKSIAARYDSAPFLEKANADGTKTRLSPAEEAAERARMKSQVQSACAVSGGG
jgi:hypothetical protein